MELIQPQFFRAFSCVAALCPDACCYGWEVEIDPDHAALYQSLDGDLGDALRSGLYRQDGTYYLKNHHGRCPMWRSDGLCALQARLGHQALSQVCQSYPRISQDYGSFLELGLEMSCPEAARLMLSDPSWVLESREIPGGEPGDYDPVWMELLRSTRPTAFALLDAPGASLGQRLALVLLYGYHVQGLLDGQEPGEFSPQAALEEAQGFAGPGDWEAAAGFYRELEILTDPWRQMLCAPPRLVWDQRLIGYARYGLYRYYYQAVSDGDLVGRIKAVLWNCVLCAHLGGSAEAIQRCAKEIENSADNMDALLDGAYAHPALTDRNLLGLLLSKNAL